MMVARTDQQNAALGRAVRRKRDRGCGIASDRFGDDRKPLSPLFAHQGKVCFASDYEWRGKLFGIGDTVERFLEERSPAQQGEEGLGLCRTAARP